MRFVASVTLLVLLTTLTTIIGARGQGPVLICYAEGGELLSSPDVDKAEVLQLVEKGRILTVTRNVCYGRDGFYLVEATGGSGIIGGAQEGYMLPASVGITKPTNCLPISKAKDHHRKEKRMTLTSSPQDSSPPKSTPQTQKDPAQQNSETLTSSQSTSSSEIRFRRARRISEIQSVAVLPLAGISCEEQSVKAAGEASVVEQELLGLYDLVDRNYLEMILEEQRLGMSGLILEEGTLAKAGCLAGAQGTVVVTKGCLADKDVLTIKMIDCTSSMMYWVASGPPDQVYSIMEEVRSKLR